MTGAVDLLATVGIREDGRDAVLAALRPVIDASRREEGCLRYDVYESGDGRIVFVERWASAEHLTRHQQQDFMAEFGRVATPFATGAPETTFLTSIEEAAPGPA